MSPSTPSTATSSMPRRPSRRRTSTSAACTDRRVAGPPAEVLEHDLAGLQRRDDLRAAGGGHAAEAEPVREGEEGGGEAMAADVADLPRLVRPRRAHARAPAAARAARSRGRACRACRPRTAARRRRRPPGPATAPRPGRAARTGAATGRVVSATKHERRSSAVRRDVRRIRCIFRSASSAYASSSRARPSSRSEWVTALRPVHGPGCSSSRNRRAFGAVPARSSPSRSARTEQASVT